MDENKLSLFKWITGILGIIAAAWLIWVSNGTVSNAKDIAVLQTNIVTIKESIDDVKAITKEIRQDQIRRERKER